MPFLVHSCTQPKTYQDNKARTMYVNECIVIKIELLGKTNLSNNHIFFTEGPFNDDNYQHLNLRYENKAITY